MLLGSICVKFKNAEVLYSFHLALSLSPNPNNHHYFRLSYALAVPSLPLGLLFYKKNFLLQKNQIPCIIKITKSASRWKLHIYNDLSTTFRTKAWLSPSRSNSPNNF